MTPLIPPNGYIRGADDVDLYLYESSINGTVEVYTEIFSEYSSDTYLRIFDAYGMELAYNDDYSSTTTTSSITLDVTKNQTYYIGINGFSENAGNYNPLTGEEVSQGSQGDYALTIEVLYVYENSVEVSFGDGSKNAVTYTDSDGTETTVRLLQGQGVAHFTGEITDTIQHFGSIEIQGINLYLQQVELSSSSQSTMLMVTAFGGDGQADIGDIDGESLSMIMAQSANLWGDITLTGSLGMMMVGDIADTATITTGQPGNGLMVIAGDVGADFDIAGSVNMFMCDSFTSGSLTADKIAMVMPRTGDLGADLTARNGDIGTVIASGAINGQLLASGNINMLMSQKGGLTGTVQAGNNIGMLMVNGDVSGRVSAMGKINMLMAMGSDITGSVRAGTEIGVLMADNLDNALLSAGGNIRMINIRRDILDSYILGGYDIGTDCAFGSQSPGGDDLFNNGNIGLVIAGGSFKRSYIGIGVLPSGPLTNTLPNIGVPAGGEGGNSQFISLGGIDPNAQDNYGIFSSKSTGMILVSGRLVDDTFDDYFRVDVLS